MRAAVATALVASVATLIVSPLMIAATPVSIVVSSSVPELRSVTTELAIAISAEATTEVVATFLLLGELDVDGSALELGVVRAVASSASAALTRTNQSPCST